MTNIPLHFHCTFHMQVAHYSLSGKVASSAKQCRRRESLSTARNELLLQEAEIRANPQLNPQRKVTLAKWKNKCMFLTAAMKMRAEMTDAEKEKMGKLRAKAAAFMPAEERLDKTIT